MTQTNDTQRRITRRQSLGLAGMAGAGVLAGRAVGLPLIGGAAAGPAKASGAASCSLAPEVTEGPFWEDEMLERSDVTGGQDGVPLEIEMTIVRSDESCAVFEGAQIDIWHANAEGNYSDEPAGQGNADTEGETWLRGYQISDSDGLVKFTTIYPGWYNGRAVHIHVRIRTFSGTSTTYNYTTQLFFPQSIDNTVGASDGYGVGDTTNDEDSIYNQEVSAGNALLVPLTGSVAKGYSGSATIALENLPAGSDPQDTSCDASLSSKKFSETKHGKRALDLKIACDEQVSAKAKLVRHGKTVAHKEIATLRSGGTRTLTIPIANDVGNGEAKLRLELEDLNGNTKSVRRSVVIPHHG